MAAGIIAVLALRSTLSVLLCMFIAYTAIAVWAARRWRRAIGGPVQDWCPPITILKPVRGADPEAYENFASFCRLDYPRDRYQIVFGALDASDSALQLVEKLQEEFPAVDIRIVRGEAADMRGRNLKVCNLMAMLPAAKHDLLVLSDSDMRVPADYLYRVAAPFAPRTDGVRVGLVTCPYRALHPRSFGAALEALGIGADFIPSALVSRALEGVSFAFGSTIALPISVLEEIGGFEPLLNELADDYRLGNGVRRAGYEVVLADCMVEDVMGREPFTLAWARRLRWARTVRACRPGGYAGSIVTYGVALALLYLLTTGFSHRGWAVFAAVTAVRILAAAWIAGRYTKDSNIRRFLPLLPVSDLFGFALYLSSFLGNRITWRGEHFRVLRGGILVNLTPDSRGAPAPTTE